MIIIIELYKLAWIKIHLAGTTSWTNSEIWTGERLLGAMMIHVLLLNALCGLKIRIKSRNKSKILQSGLPNIKEDLKKLPIAMKPTARP